jgi:hypothetical protein
MDVGRYKSVNTTNPRGGYQVPYVETTQIFIAKMVILLGQIG